MCFCFVFFTKFTYCCYVDSPSAKRKYRDQKFGFGGKKSGKKWNTKESYNDVSSFRAKVAQAKGAYSDVLFGILQNREYDMQFRLSSTDDFCSTTEREKTKSDSIYEDTVREVAIHTYTPSNWEDDIELEAVLSNATHIKCTHSLASLKVRINYEERCT